MTSDVALAPISDACALLGITASRYYGDVARGLLPPPVRLGKRTVRVVEHEMQTVARALVAGATEAQRRQLARDLVAQRAALMPPLLA